MYLDKTTKTADAAKFVFVYPKNATNTALTWKSSDSTIAKVSDKGVITALKKGTTVITATAHNGISAIFTVHAVTDGTVIRAQSVSPTYAALAVGGKTVLTASQTGGTGAYRTGTFYCDNSSVLSLSISGNQCTVTALKPGEANVYAISSSGRVAVCEVLVKPRFVQSLTAFAERAFAEPRRNGEARHFLHARQRDGAHLPFRFVQPRRRDCE